MFKNYFTIAWRNLLKHKADTSINLLGLCVAFTSALLLFLSVYYEFSFDRFHKNARNIYHLYFETHTQKGPELSRVMPVPLLPSLKAMYPDVVHGVRFINSSAVVRYKDKQIGQNLRFTDPDFLKMFSFPLLAGDPSTALSSLNNVVLRKGSAKAIFGDEDPLNKSIQIKLAGEWKNFVVSAILDEFPDNSSINYDMIIRFEQIDDYVRNATIWDNLNHDVYVELKKGVSSKTFEKKLPSFITQYFGESIKRLQRDGAIPAIDGSFIKLHLQPFLDSHTDTSIAAEDNNISSSYLYLLLVIGSLIITIACINFINLSLGRSFTRSREIGLRKTLGAQPSQLVFQFWTEAFIICLLAFIASCFFAWLLLPEYKRLFAMNVQQRIIYSPVVWAGVLATFMIITLLAGGYPAWIMSRFNIVNILKGKLSVKHSQRLRHTLLVVQFFIAILLIICTLISWQQITYLRSRPLGYNRNEVISIPVSGEIDPTKALQLMRDKLASHPVVESVSGIYDNLGRGTDGSSRTSIMGFDYKNREIKTYWMGVSYDFVKTLDLTLISGRDFSPAFQTDSNAVLINESMARQVGEKQMLGIQLPVDSAKPLQVIGVFKDFNFQSLHHPIEPLTLALSSNFSINYILVKVKPNNLSGSMALMKKSWLEIAPNTEFRGSFLDENIDRQYRRESKLGQIFIVGAGIAITLSCMGLLAMVLLVITQRVKEIGVRKVLGASVGNIVMILSKDFLRLVCLAAVLAFPVSWWAMHSWLSNYAYRISIEWWVFGLAALLALLITMATIGYQSIKAAFSNPVKSLRVE